MELNFTAPINDRSYGVVGLNLLKSLTELGHSITLFPIGGVQITSSKDDALVVQNAYLKQERYNPDAPSIRLWHQFDLAQHVGKKLHVGFPIFELNKFNERETHHLQSQDLLLVCSKWAKSVINTELKGKDDVHVVPLGVDCEIFRPAEKPLQTNGIVRFLNIGKIEYRKGHDVLIDAFCKAFDAGEDVELWISWDNPFLDDSEVEPWKKMYKESPLGDKVKLIPWLPNQLALTNLINLVHVGVFPSRAEGWNLPALEIMACGKSIIATNYSGHTEFLTPDNAFLIEGEELETAYDGKWFHGQGEWFTFGENQMEQLIEGMRANYILYKDNLDLVNNRAIADARQFSWENSALSLVDAVRKYV